MDLQFTIIKEIEFNYSQDNFWDAMQVWISKPHTLNKRVLSFEQIAEFRAKVFSPSDINKIRNMVLKDVNFVKEVQNYKDYKIQESKKMLNKQRMVVNIRKIIPRNLTFFDCCIEMIVTDFDAMKIIFFNLSPHLCKPSVSCTFPYVIHFNEGKVYLKVEPQSSNKNASCNINEMDKKCTCESYRSKTMSWLQDTLLPKLIKWAANSNKNNNMCPSSLRLIDNMSLYSSQYNALKLKYGKEITRIWPEVTDPSKFVYEDLAIAAYLMLLWQNQATSFVDLGCGNGLLVHILNSEGHQGFGVDVRKRKIWDLYPSSTVLKVDTISPSASALFPRTEWIIGNHSDELTPWIPIITARSHMNCKMFLLPCCAYQFNGHKYQRRNSKVSIYNDYLNYISQDICTSLCEFSVEMDRLRIPSTKRIAIVCRRREYKTREDSDRVDAKIEMFLKRLEHVDNMTCEKTKSSDKEENESEKFRRDEICLGEKSKEEGKPETDNLRDVEDTDTDEEKLNRGNEEYEDKAKRLKLDLDGRKSWMKNIKTRENTETVKNCTQIDKTIVQTIVDIIVECLLAKQLESNTSWRDENEYHISLGEIIRHVKSRDEKLLRELSQQNGGIKTLIRNKHDIFLVVKDNVEFRKPSERVRNEHWKSKPCWFQRNHPFQCPLSNEQCGFIH